MLRAKRRRSLLRAGGWMTDVAVLGADVRRRTDRDVLPAYTATDDGRVDGCGADRAHLRGGRLRARCVHLRLCAVSHSHRHRGRRRNVAVRKPRGCCRSGARERGIVVRARSIIDQASHRHAVINCVHAGTMGGSSKTDAVQRLSPLQNAVVGTAAGTIEITLLQPLLYWKNAAQQHLPFTLNPRLLYRGLGVSVVNMSALTGLQFPLTSMVTRVMTGGAVRPLSDGEMIGSAFAGGALSGFLCSPMELVLVQQQRHGGTIFGTPARILRQFGGTGMMRGLVTSCGREGLFTMGYLGLGPVLARTLTESHDMGSGQAKVLGAMGAGIVAATASHPLDTLKTVMQGDLERKVSGTLTQTASRLYSEHGIGRFFKGLGYRTFRMILAISIMMECKARLSPLFFPALFADDYDDGEDDDAAAAGAA